MYTREDWTLFRSLSTLCQKAGAPVHHLRRLVAKEVVDNALDATEGITAEGLRVDVAVLSDGLRVTDVGPGLAGDPETIAALFSIRRPLRSSKLIRLPMRGALGNGLRVVAGAVLASGGSLDVWTRDRHLHLVPQDDGETAVQWEAADYPVGTCVEVHLGEAVPADAGLEGWLTRLCWFEDANASYRGKTSAYWYDADAFFELLQAAGERPVRAVVAELEGWSGAKAGSIAAPYLNRAAGSLAREDASALLASARAASSPVKAQRLGTIGEWSHCPEAYAKTTLLFPMPGSRGAFTPQIPCVVEAWAELRDGGQDDTLAVYVNRSPIVATIEAIRQRGNRTSIALFGCGLAHLVPVGQARVSIMLNIQTPAMPITSDGKEPDLTPMLGAIVAVIEKVTRKARRLQPRTESASQSLKEFVWERVEQAAAEESQNGRIRFTQRSLFYAMRPAMIDFLCGGDPQWGTFTSIITDYEGLHGPLTGMTRDVRGVLYHPHRREEIALGTLSVERYARPKWTFNKILYIEKEGLFSVLQSVDWPERHDCALLTAKGYASRAARDVLDRLGDDGEEILFFCIHDADGPGTMIYQTLQEATRARHARRVRIINLGLEPDEAEALGLPVETFQARSTRVPVASYVREPWPEWLQTHRVELNALRTAGFIAWLDEKIAPYDQGKVIPPADVLIEERDGMVEEMVRERITARILREADVDGQVVARMAELIPDLDAEAEGLEDWVEDQLEAEPAHRWDAPIRSRWRRLLGDTP